MYICRYRIYKYIQKLGLHFHLRTITLKDTKALGLECHEQTVKWLDASGRTVVGQSEVTNREVGKPDRFFCCCSIA